MHQSTQIDADPWMRGERFLKQQFIIVVINRMASKIILVHVLGMSISTSSLPTQRLLLAFGRVVDQVLAMVDVCLLSAITANQRLVFGYLAEDAFVTAL